MMIFGVLFVDDKHKLSEVELINTARRAFERRALRTADLALLSLSTDYIPNVDGLLVLRSHLVRPYQTIVGVHVLENVPV